jgi:hypothetical protein
MATVPQVHPLWLAEVREHEVHAGRVVAWQVAETGTAPGAATATPVVAFTTQDGLMLEAGAPRGPLCYLADTRDEAVAAASAAAPATDSSPRGPGHPPVPPDDEDDPRPPDRRARFFTLRRLTQDDPAASEPAAQESGQAVRRIHRHDI